MASGKILIVDDDRNICELLRLYIEKEGFETAIANDGKAAVQMFDAVNPDLILLDIMLPELDGWQVCREIRKKSQCPIIMLTAKGEVFDKVLGLELGADDYVVKPFEAKEVIARINAVPEPRLYARPAARRGVGLRLLWRFPHRRRARQAPAREARGRFRQVGAQNGLGRRLQV